MMRKYLVCTIILLLLSMAIGLSSCVDSDYHWNNINREGVIDVPPVPLGSYEASIFKFLDQHVIEIPEIPSITIEYVDTLKNIFDGTTVKRFFHQYMERDFRVEGELHMFLLGKDSEMKLSVGFDALDINNNILEGVVIDGISEDELQYGIQHVSIVIPKESRGYIKDAHHLLLRFRMTTPTSVVLTEDDYVKLNNLVIKASGFHFDL